MPTNRSASNGLGMNSSTAKHSPHRSVGHVSAVLITTTGILLQSFVGLNLLENFAAALLRQLQVQQDQVGPGGLGEDPFPMDESQCLFTVADQAHTATDMPTIEHLHRRPGVDKIVLDQEDFHGPADDRSAENALSHKLSVPF